GAEPRPPRAHHGADRVALPGVWHPPRGSVRERAGRGRAGELRELSPDSRPTAQQPLPPPLPRRRATFAPSVPSASPASPAAARPPPSPRTPNSRVRPAPRHGLGARQNIAVGSGPPPFGPSPRPGIHFPVIMSL